MEIYLAKTQGFCAGVAFAVDIVEQALSKYGSPLYVYHEIVHNTYVVNGFRDKGVVFVEDIDNLPYDRYILWLKDYEKFVTDCENEHYKKGFWKNLW